MPRKEKEKLWMTVFPHASSTYLTSSLVALASFLSFLPPPPHLRHFHLCSLGLSEEYEMATLKQSYIRSLWFFESHLRPRNSSHSCHRSKVKAKGSWMHLPKMCPLARESEVLSIQPSPQSCPPKRSALLFPREPQGSFWSQGSNSWPWVYAPDFLFNKSLE